MRIVALFALLALSACGEFRSWNSICQPSSDPSPIQYRPSPGRYAVASYTAEDKDNADWWADHQRDRYIYCWDRVSAEVISMSGTDAQAKAQAANTCKQELANYRRDSELFHFIARRLENPDTPTEVQSGAARQDAEREVADLKQSVELRIDTFRLCHANRDQWRTKYSCFGVFPSSWCGAV